MIELNKDIQTGDIVNQLSFEKLGTGVKVNIPDDFYQNLLTQLLERDYLSDTGHMKFLDSKTKYAVNWMQITRLPVHPNENESYDLFSRWQGVLTSLHAWGYRLYFLLMRYDGKTKLFIGTASSNQNVAAQQAIEQLRESTFGSMPGMGLRLINDKMAYDEIHQSLQNMRSIGAVTGIPSFKKTEQNLMLQTLDQLAFGIRDIYGTEKNYAMLVMADPISDHEVTDIVARYRRLSSGIHTAVKMSSSEMINKSETKDPKAKKRAGINMLGSVVGAIAGCVAKAPMAGALVGTNLTTLLTADMSSPIQYASSASTNYEYLDKFAEYAEEAANYHVTRLNEGRSYGFWNTGIYVLADMNQDVMTVTGMLRSIYSGEETYYEPIRLHLFKSNPEAMNIVRNNFDLLPLIQEGKENTDKEWHLLGKYYQYLSTPMNTRELSLATSLPRRDVPGLRFVKTAVRFANNPAEVERDNIITLGNIVDTGVVQDTTYDIDVNSLVRHALVSGSTGSGKSTTCKRLLAEVLQRNVPIMVIEPAKDDYVRWALEMNKSLPPEKQFKIYMPGVKEFEGHRVEELKLNPFEPAYCEGAEVDLLQHSETFATLLNACLPAEEVVPILIEETVYETIREFAESNDRLFDDGFVEPMNSYPKVSDMLNKAIEIMAHKSYAQLNKDNLTEVLATRFKSLERGMRGKILNVKKSTSYQELFSGNVIINISRLSGTKDKALIMSLLMQALYEYRISCYSYDKDYRNKAQKNKLLHLTLIEEAHNVLLKPSDHAGSGSPQRAAAELFANMLSEVRGYGQGFIVVDQVPTRLIDDVIKNTNYKIIHRLTAPDDQEVMASCMAFRDDQKYIIPALEKGNAIICGDEDDAASWVRIPAPGKNLISR